MGTALVKVFEVVKGVGSPFVKIVEAEGVGISSTNSVMSCSYSYKSKLEAVAGSAFENVGGLLDGPMITCSRGSARSCKISGASASTDARVLR